MWYSPKIQHTEYFEKKNIIYLLTLIMLRDVLLYTSYLAADNKKPS